MTWSDLLYAHQASSASHQGLVLAVLSQVRLSCWTSGMLGDWKQRQSISMLLLASAWAGWVHTTKQKSSVTVYTARLGAALLYAQHTEHAGGCSPACQAPVLCLMHLIRVASARVRVTHATRVMYE